MKRKQSKVTADLKKNRLIITLVGVISVEGLQEVYTEIRFCVADLKPGFCVINDMTQCRVGQLAALGTFGKVREYLNSHDVGTVIRVVKKKQIVFNQISRVIDKKRNILWSMFQVWRRQKQSWPKLNRK